MWIYVEAPDDLLLTKRINELNKTEDVKDHPNSFEESRVMQVVHTRSGRAMVEIEQIYYHYPERS